MAYTLPTITPLYGDALDDVFHDVIQGICGFSDGSLIRPRWQPEPPNQPDFNVDWVAFGVQTADADVYAYGKHDPSGNGGLGADQVERDETLKVLISFYGPNSTMLISQFRDGIQIDSNRDALTAVGIKLQECQTETVLPALLKEKWVKRIDTNVIFRRRVKRSYAVNTIVSANVGLNNGQYVTAINNP